MSVYKYINVSSNTITTANYSIVPTDFILLRTRPAELELYVNNGLDLYKNGVEQNNFVELVKDSSDNLIGLTVGSTNIAFTLGPYNLANLPAATTYSGYRAKVSDIGGAGGSMWYSNGIRWMPENGALTIGSNNTRLTVTGTTETILKQWLLPIKSLQDYDRFVLHVTATKSAASETAAFNIRFGRLGTVADTLIFSNTNLATTNRTMAVDLEFKRMSSTTIQREGAGSLGSAFNVVTTAVYPATTTVDSMDINPMYITITMYSTSTGVEQLAVEDCIARLLAYIA